MSIKKNRKTNLKNETVSGISWNFITQGVGLLNQLIVGVILARLLPPEDFGLIGLSMIVIGFGNLFVNLGLGPALIQRKEISEDHIRICFTISGFAGILLAIIVYLSAPFLAVLFNDPRIHEIIEFLSIIFVFAGLQVPSEAILKRNLCFKKLFKITLVNVVIYGIITITLALNGWGVWSLVGGIIIKGLVNLLQNYFSVRHSVIPLIKKREFYDLAYFGGGMSLLSIFNYLANKGDYFIVGKLLGASSLGLYTRAYNLMQMPTNKFARVISNVLFPAASKIQHENVKFQNAFLKTLRVVSFIVFPIVGLLFMTAPDLIITVYGKKWEGAIEPFQILVLFGLFRALYNISGAFIKAKGKVYQLFCCQVIYGILVIFGVWYIAPEWGLSGVAWVVGIAITFQYLALMYLGSNIAKINIWDTFSTIRPSLIITIPTLGITYLMNFVFLVSFSLPSYLTLIFIVLIGLISYMFFLYIIPQNLLKYVPYEILCLLDKYLPQKSFLYKKILNHFSPNK